jgi:urease accessory protein UreF
VSEGSNVDDVADTADTADTADVPDAPDAAVLESMRLADSSLPVGTDSVSYGLEAFVAADRVEDADDLAGLLETYLRRQLGPGDLVALRAGTNTWIRLLDVADRVGDVAARSRDGT